MINADSLGYVSHKGLVEAIGIPEEHLCTGCLTGIYLVAIRMIGGLPIMSCWT